MHILKQVAATMVMVVICLSNASFQLVIIITFMHPCLTAE